MFGSIAGRYDLANRVLSMGLDRSWRRAAVRAAAPRAGETLLDLACGTGDLAGALAGSGARIVAADFTLPMLLRARARLPAEVSAVAADALRLPFPDRVFDAVTVAFGLRNFADRDAALREMRRILRPGGRFVVLEFSRPRGVLAPFLRLYVERLVPPLGRLLTGRDGPYVYLADSIRTWPTAESLAGRCAAAGFTDVRHRPLLRGVAALHTGRRPR